VTQLHPIMQEKLTLKPTHNHLMGLFWFKLNSMIEQINI